MKIDHPKNCDITVLRDIWKEAFGDTEVFLDLFFKTAFKPENALAVFEGDVAVSMLYWFDCEYCGEKIAYVYAVATAKKYRGKGICKAMLENLHKLLKARAYEGALLVPGNKKLFEFYKKLGYITCCSVDYFECDASNQKTEIRIITKSQYAKLRREYLPKRSVVQEKENLDFLATYASFYTGENFLLAAYKDKNKLTGVEYLGDKAKAKDVVSALGCIEGTFMMPGNGTEFAMYHSIGTRGLLPPKYFGLAFN